DYVTKPFSPRELVLRVGAVLRRTQSPAVTGTSRLLRGGPVTVDLSAMTAYLNDEPLDLTPTEYRLLTTLLERRGRVHTRQRLRAKLGDAGAWIETVRGFGYRFRARDEGE